MKLNLVDRDGSRVNLSEIADHELSWSFYFLDPDGNRFELTCYDYAEVREVSRPPKAMILVTGATGYVGRAAVSLPQPRRFRSRHNSHRLSSTPALEIRMMPTTSRQPKGSPAHSAAVTAPTLISVMNNSPTMPGLSYFAPQIDVMGPEIIAISIRSIHQGSAGNALSPVRHRCLIGDQQKRERERRTTTRNCCC